MPYKDLEKQREAVRQATARRRVLLKGRVGITEPLKVSPEGIAIQGITSGITRPPKATGITEGITKEGITDTSNTQNTGKTLPPEWQAVKTFLTTPAPGMPRLERMQRIAGSLGKYQSEVFFGLGGLTVKDISGVIGELPPLYAHPGR